MPSGRRNEVIKRCAEGTMRRIDGEQCCAESSALSPSTDLKIGMPKVLPPARAGADRASGPNANDLPRAVVVREKL